MAIIDSVFNLSKKGLKTTGQGIKKGAEFTYNHREEIKGSASGLVHGLTKTLKGVYGAIATKEEIEARIDKLNKQSIEYRNLINQLKEKNRLGNKNKKQILFDSLMTSSLTGFTYYNTNVIPDDIQEAFEMAYPNVAARQSLQDIIDNASIAEAEGYINGIKGKLFEIRYTEHLNNSDILPYGFHAEMAASVTNSGWDIAIINDSTERIADTLQLKATEQVSYVKDALERYPDIDIVTTNEVYNQLAMTEYADNVINSGISNSEITDAVEEVFSNNNFDFDWCPSIVSFLVIGYSVSKKKHLSEFEKGKEFGGRMFSSWIGYLVGGTTTMLTGGAWIAGIAAAMITNSTLEIGRQKYKYIDSLDNSIKDNDRIIKRLKLRLAAL